MMLRHFDGRGGLKRSWQHARVRRWTVSVLLPANHSYSCLSKLPKVGVRCRLLYCVANCYVTLKLDWERY